MNFSLLLTLSLFLFGCCYATQIISNNSPATTVDTETDLSQKNHTASLFRESAEGDTFSITIGITWQCNYANTTLCNAINSATLDLTEFSTSTNAIILSQPPKQVVNHYVDEVFAFTGPADSNATAHLYYKSSLIPNFYLQIDITGYFLANQIGWTAITTYPTKRPSLFQGVWAPCYPPTATGVCLMGVITLSEFVTTFSGPFTTGI